MKKNKKFATPVIETKDNYDPFTVEGLIDVLKEFPKDSKFELNGAIKIKDCMTADNGESLSVNISIPAENNNSIGLENINYENDNDAGKFVNGTGELVDNYLYGICPKDNNFLDMIRKSATDTIINSPLTMPNNEESSFEQKYLAPNQCDVINEIRQHNTFIAECLGEIHRREVAALLEYNTQCLAHFGIETNKTMCVIADTFNADDEI